MSDKKEKTVKSDQLDADQFNGFNIKINEFGEVICSHSMDDINDYLDQNVEDKKLKVRKDDRS